MIVSKDSCDHYVNTAVLMVNPEHGRNVVNISPVEVNNTSFLPFIEVTRDQEQVNIQSMHNRM